MTARSEISETQPQKDLLAGIQGPAPLGGRWVVSSDFSREISILDSERHDAVPEVQLSFAGMVNGVEEALEKVNTWPMYVRRLGYSSWREENNPFFPVFETHDNHQLLEFAEYVITSGILATVLIPHRTRGVEHGFDKDHVRALTVARYITAGKPYGEIDWQETAHEMRRLLGDHPAASVVNDPNFRHNRITLSEYQGVEIGLEATVPEEADEPRQDSQDFATDVFPEASSIPAESPQAIDVFDLAEPSTPTSEAEILGSEASTPFPHIIDREIATYFAEHSAVFEPYATGFIPHRQLLIRLQALFPGVDREVLKSFTINMVYLRKQVVPEISRGQKVLRPSQFEGTALILYFALHPHKRDPKNRKYTLATRRAVAATEAGSAAHQFLAGSLKEKEKKKNGKPPGGNASAALSVAARGNPLKPAVREIFSVEDTSTTINADSDMSSSSEVPLPQAVETTPDIAEVASDSQTDVEPELPPTFQEAGDDVTDGGDVFDASELGSEAWYEEVVAIVDREEPLVDSSRSVPVLPRTPARPPTHRVSPRRASTSKPPAEPRMTYSNGGKYPHDLEKLRTGNTLLERLRKNKGWPG